MGFNFCYCIEKYQFLPKLLKVTRKQSFSPNFRLNQLYTFVVLRYLRGHNEQAIGPPVNHSGVIDTTKFKLTGLKFAWSKYGMEYDSDDEDKKWPKNFEHKQNLKDNKII